MRIAIYGTGGVGGYFGGRLAQAGEEVVFIARGEHLQALRTTGLRVDSVKGDFLVHPVHAAADPARVGVVDAVLVCVKAWQVPEAAAALRPMVGPETIVVPLENGVDAVPQLAAGLGAEHVLGGLCRISTFLAGPGHIQHVAIDPYIAFGELDNQPSERAENLRQAFAKAGVNVEIPADIQAAIWMKFLFIAAVSGIGAVTRTPLGVVRSLPESRQMLAEALSEVDRIARARKIALPDGAAALTLARIDALPGETVPSMQRDIVEGRPSELGAQNGAVVRMGLELGIPTPVHAFIYNSLLPQELKARGEL